MADNDYYMGIDLGSVSLNVVIVDREDRIRKARYRRTEGRPLPVLQDCLEELAPEFRAFQGIVATGSGRKLVGGILDVPDINEIVTQAKAACHCHHDVRTIVEIGGQDSKLIFVDRHNSTGQPVVADHVLNEVCAAGTGSFLDLQAHRLGIKVESMGALALRATHPARISGRCSVFAKSDMVHLLQEGTPKPDIVAGLCNALALNFITNLGKGKPFSEPIVFQGGVAANPGVVRAFEQHLQLSSGSMIIPEHFLVMGAFGSAIMARNGHGLPTRTMKGLIDKVSRAVKADRRRSPAAHLKPLVRRKVTVKTADKFYGAKGNTTQDVFLGIDVGAVSTNIVLIDARGDLIAKQYWFTQGELADTVRKGLKEMGQRVGDQVRVLGVGVTGSGRYFIADFVGGDVVINEISAQARAAVHCDPEVDTIIEIGGQDSKYIRCENGHVIDFEMNKVCAAGTGSFLEEQAARLKVPIRESFSKLAFSSDSPVDLGARCTVFMESDLVHHQQTGKSIGDLAAGLAYAIASNYQEKVVGTKKMGRRIFFQGGVAGNQSVGAAFESLLGQSVTTPQHHNVMGAVGAALAAKAGKGASSRFAGFHLKDRPYAVKTFECPKCPNRCRIHGIYIEDRLTSYYGSLCGRYDQSAQDNSCAHLPDLFRERADRLDQGPVAEEPPARSLGPRIGIPKVLGFFDRFPFWNAFFKALGHSVVLSEDTNKTLVQQGLAHVPSETCFPIKAVYGHMVDLISKGAQRILLPCEIDHPQRADKGLRTFNCPYVQSIPYMVQSAMGSKVSLLAPIIKWSTPATELQSVFLALGKSLGHSPEKTGRAVAAAWQAQARFERWRQDRGQENLASHDPNSRCLVLLGKTHNIFDPGLNLHLAKKLRRLGQHVMPFDMLPLEDMRLPKKYDNVVWKNTRDLLKALLWMKDRPSFFPVLLTNFGCGPDSFLLKYMETELPEKPHLVLEVDDHTGDAGMVTRIEAFLDTLDSPRKTRPWPSRPFNLIIKGTQRSVDPWNPDRRILKRLEGRTLYFPYVSKAFCHVVRAAFQSVNIKAEILPEPDQESEYLGRQVTSGRECHPFVVTSGEFVKLTRRTDFDPDRAAILMQNYDGACRFSQYGMGHADLMGRLGLSQVPVVAPLTSPRFDEFSRLFGLRFTKVLWQGWLAAEVLERIRLHTRPYEKIPGQTDGLYTLGIQGIADAVGRSNGGAFPWSRAVLAPLRRATRALEGVPVDRSQDRPKVGIVGEFYTVLNRWANHDLVRTLEDLGAEVTLHGLSVSNFYALFSEHYYPRGCFNDGRPLSALYFLLRNQWMMSWVRQAEAFLPESLRPFGTLDAKYIVHESDPFIHYDIDPVLATYTARVRRFAATGISGICNLFVLNCMLGNVAIPVFKNALGSYKNLPVLHAVYDAQEQTNMLTRIEAFMHQVRLYEERHR
jgi:predicted CoA-substrate-specific enzyme activase